MKNKLKLFLGMALFISGVANAQVGIGTTNPQGALDITSTSGGLLVPRMTTTDRNGVTPANAMLIFNTTNNTFEVYKSTCSCWVTVNDGGNVPASSLVNTPPTASDLNISGKFMVLQTATLTYKYADAQNDLEGLTSIEWQRASSSVGGDAVTIAGANTATYTFQPSDIGTWIRARVFPRAATGVLNGVVATTGWTVVESSTMPTANSLAVTGTASIGSVLNASYTFAGGSGTEDTTPSTFGGTSSGTSYVWQSANSNVGEGISNVGLYGAFAFTPNYTPQNDLLGKFIRVGVRAKDTNALQATNWVYSPWIGPLTATSEVAPVVSNVTFSPAPAVSLVHTASYTYFDANFDPEGASIFQWYRANDAAGAGAVAIVGATSKTYTSVAEDLGKYLGFGVIPVAQTGTATGVEVKYYNPIAVAASATFTFTGSSMRQNPFYGEGRLMNAQNAIQVEIDVTSAGGLSVSSPVVNGYSFVSNFTVPLGTQWITLTPTGAQTSYDAAGDLITLTGIGNTTETKSINIYHTKKGSDYAAHYNGFVGGVNVDNTLATYTTGETFNNNGTCVNAFISSGTCPAGNTVTGASGAVYPTVLINGQCWMQTNLKEIPSNYTSLPAWNAATIADIGQHGFYNVATPAGTAGWAATEPSTTHGRLYQWSAAMNGATYERAQGACPTGWHVPSDCEWRYLEHGIGMSITQTNTQQNHAGAVAQKLRDLPANGGGTGGVTGTNSSGFAMKLVGARADNGVFSANTTGTSIWTSTTYLINAPGTANHRQYSTATTRFWEAWKNNRTASVRCLKD